MKIVAIKDMSAGNQETGEAWQETKVFNSTDTLFDVCLWAFDNYQGFPSIPSKKRLTITIPEQEAVDETNRARY